MRDKQFNAVRAAFDRAAPRYEQAAVLQREVTQRLMERLAYIRVRPQRILDLGAGTGSGARALRGHYPQADIVALDCAMGMLRQLQARSGWWRKPMPVCADVRRLPFRDHSFELVFSSLTLQWCDDPAAVFQEILRVLKPGGVLIFSTLGPDTLKELRLSWAAVDGAAHVNEFQDMHIIGDALLKAGFADPVMDVESITLTYPAVDGLLRDLKYIGANTVLAADRRSEGLTGKHRITTMKQAYAGFRTPEGLYPASYEVVYGLAWGRDPAVRPLSFVPAEILQQSR